MPRLHAEEASLAMWSRGVTVHCLKSSFYPLNSWNLLSDISSTKFASRRGGQRMLFLVVGAQVKLHVSVREVAFALLGSGLSGLGSCLRGVA